MYYPGSPVTMNSSHFQFSPPEREEFLKSTLKFSLLKCTYYYMLRKLVEPSVLYPLI